MRNQYAMAINCIEQMVYVKRKVLYLDFTPGPNWPTGGLPSSKPLPQLFSQKSF